MAVIYPLLASMLRGYRRVAPTERGGYRLARFVRRFRPRDQWRGVYRTPGGFVMTLDLGVYPDCCMAFGLYELDTERLIRRILRPGDRFVDAGANIGYFTMLAASVVGDSGRVDAFEPQPDNRARLIEHLQRNELADRVRVHPLALGDRDDTVTIHYYIDRLNHGSSTLFVEPDARTRRVEVPMRRMDDVLADVDTAPVRLVKMDIEGAEPLAIAGMARLLGAEQPPMIVCEFNPSQARVAGFDSAETVRRVLDIQPRYTVYRVGWRLQRLTDPLNDLPRLRQCNLLFRPSP